MKPWWLAVCLTPLLGQTLTLSQVSGVAGEEVKVKVSYLAGGSVVGLEWETVFSPHELILKENSAAPGPVAKKAGRSLVCRGEQKDTRTYAVRCLVIGGQTPLTSGVVAVLRLRIPAGSQPGKIAIRIRSAEGVTAASEKVAIERKDAIVTVR